MSQIRNFENHFSLFAKEFYAIKLKKLILICSHRSNLNAKFYDLEI